MPNLSHFTSNFVYLFLSIPLLLFSLASCGGNRNNSPAPASEQAAPAADSAIQATNQEQPSTQAQAVDDGGGIEPAEVASQQSTAQTTQQRVQTGAGASNTPSALPAPLYFIDGNNQILRLEADGLTISQITNEAEPVTDFDISPVDGRIVYVAGNDLIETTARGHYRTLKVSGASVDINDPKSKVTNQISQLHFSPDGTQIAFGLNGVNLIPVGPPVGAKLIQPSDPYPDEPDAPNKGVRFFWPAGWSPDGKQLLIQFSDWSAAGGLTLRRLSEDTTVDITSTDENGISCCEWAWGQDGQHGFIASNLLAYGSPGLAKVAIGSGDVGTLIRGLPEGAQISSTNPFRLFRKPLQLQDGTILAFISSLIELNQPALYTMNRVATDGSLIIPMREDKNLLIGDALWAKDGRGAVIVDAKSGGSQPFIGPLVWLPANGGPARQLPAMGHQLRWGLANVAEEVAKIGDTDDLSDDVTADLAVQAAIDLGIDLKSKDAFEGVGVLGLNTNYTNNQALKGEQSFWAIFTIGVRRPTSEKNHMVAVYTRANGHWQLVDQLIMSDSNDGLNPQISPDFLADFSLVQVNVEPENLWIQIEGGIGAHGGTYHLLKFDGESLQTTAASFSASLDAGYVTDVNRDGIREVVLNATEYYVFCYACGVQIAQHELLRWDGSRMVPVTLQALPESTPANIRGLNNRAIAMAEGGLWKEALALIEQAAALDANSPILTWNAAYIGLNGEAKRDLLSDDLVAYPLLDNIFYGDYETALSLVREYQVENNVDQIFSRRTPLVVGTVAEDRVETLADWIEQSTSAAVEVQPDLAGAYFLRGWSTWLADSNDPTALTDIIRASELTPNDELFSASVLHLTGGIGGSSPQSPNPEEAAEQPIAESATPQTTEESTAESATDSVSAAQPQPISATDSPAEVPATVTPISTTAPNTATPVPAPTNTPVPPSITGINNQPVNLPTGNILYSAQERKDRRDTIFMQPVAPNTESTMLIFDVIRPNLSNDGQRLAFRSTRNDTLGVGGQNMSTGQRERYAYFIEDTNPSWDPANNLIVYSSNNFGDNRSRVYTVWADTTSTPHDLGIGQDPDWHPWQDLIVYKGCDDFGNQCGLWTMQSNGANKQQLTDNPGDQRPRWSPDGRTIVFMSDERHGNWEIYRVDIETKEVIRLTENGTEDGLPVVSPSGEHVAFISTREAALWQIWIMPIDGGSAQLLAPINGNMPDWLDQGLDWIN